jgi:selenocysteine-specific elongation factor
LIIATAGHVDHGKTLLVKALTGVDTDRLPEEQARGMTIDLGFAYHTIKDAAGNAHVIGFIDVPGHERFVRNMLAGVAGIDFALLVIAADDGPMPQTREHLAILELLGITNGAVALTKIDRVSHGRLTEAKAEVQSLLQNTPLTTAPIVPIATPNGIGIPELRDLLVAAAIALHARAEGGHFRLAIDRSFILGGAGRVVTGTAYSGRVCLDDRLMLAPSGIEVRVRSIHAQNRAVDSAGAGERCGINIASPDLRRVEIHRGDWLLAPALNTGSTRLGVQLRVLASEGKALQDRTPVHLHLGAADLAGRVSLLGERGLPPGTTGVATLVLDEPAFAVRGDRFVLRDQSATRTIGGGVVLDPVPTARSISRAKRLETLAALVDENPAANLTRLLEQSPDGVDFDWFRRVWNLAPSEVDMLTSKIALTQLTMTGGTLALTPERWTQVTAEILAGVRGHHQEFAAQAGLNEVTLRQRLTSPIGASLARAAITALIKDGALARTAGLLHIAGHTGELSRADANLLPRVRTLLERHGLQAPAAHDMVEPLKITIQILQPFLERAAHNGLLIKVSKYRYYLPSALQQLALLTEQLASEQPDGSFTAAAYRDRSGIGRNVTIEVLEYFDRIGLTMRHGQIRKLRRKVADTFGSPT